LLLPSLKFWDAHREESCQKSGKAHFLHFLFAEFFHFLDSEIRLSKGAFFVAVAALNSAFAKVGIRPTFFWIFAHWHTTALAVFIIFHVSWHLFWLRKVK